VQTKKGDLFLCVVRERKLIKEFLLLQREKKAFTSNATLTIENSLQKQKSLKQKEMEKSFLHSRSVQFYGFIAP